MDGDLIQVPLHALHTAEVYWGENATAFSPKRFVDNPDLTKEWFYLPFGGGSRNCIGMRFALMQGRSCTAFLVKNFNIRFAEDFVDDVTMTVESPFGNVYILKKFELITYGLEFAKLRISSLYIIYLINCKICLLFR